MKLTWSGRDLPGRANDLVAGDTRGDDQIVGPGLCLKIVAGESEPNFRGTRFEEGEVFAYPFGADSRRDSLEFDGEEGGGALLQVIRLSEKVLDAGGQRVWWLLELQLGRAQIAVATVVGFAVAVEMVVGLAPAVPRR
jgi:hypothetical protein